jgi:hypothetical protein
VWTGATGGAYGRRLPLLRNDEPSLRQQASPRSWLDRPGDRPLAAAFSTPPVSSNPRSCSPPCPLALDSCAKLAEGLWSARLPSAQPTVFRATIHRRRRCCSSIPGQTQQAEIALAYWKSDCSLVEKKKSSLTGSSRTGESLF